MQKFEIGTFPLQSERLTTKLQRPVYQVGNNQVKCIDPNPCYVRIKQNICMYIYECSTYQLNISVSQSFSQHVLVFSVNKKLRLKKKSIILLLAYVCHVPMVTFDIDPFQIVAHPFHHHTVERCIAGGAAISPVRVGRAYR